MTVHALGQSGSSFHTFSAPDFHDLRDAWQGQVDLASYHVFMASATLGRDAEVLFGFAVSGGYFPILRTNPALGRLLAPADEEGSTGAQRVTVLSHATWRDRFGADSSVIGRSVTLNGEPFTIVGVAEPGFGGHIGGIAGALWVPLAASLGPDAHAKMTNRRQTWLEIIGRAPGLVPAQVAERLSTTSVLLGRAAGLDWDRRVDVRRYSAMPAPMLLPVLGFLGLMLVLGGTVLLISSSNIAGVMVARAMARSRDTAIRLAIGASRSRLIRQLLIETLIVFTLGGALGVALSWSAVSSLTRISLPLPLPVPLQLDFAPDWRVLLASLVVVLSTGLAFGLLPALQSTRAGAVGALHDGAPSAAGRLRFRSLLVAAQVAGSTLLIVTSGLFIRALDRAAEVDLGFDPHNVHVLAADFRLLHYSHDQRLAFAGRFEQELRARPGTIATGAIDQVPLSLGNQGSAVTVDGRATEAGEGLFWTDHAIVTPGYFGVVGIPIIRGRGFDASDQRGGLLSIVMNEALASRIWPGQDPIGRPLRWGTATSGQSAVVVGLTPTGKYRSLGEQPMPMIYLAVAQNQTGSLSFLVRHAPNDAGIGSAMRATARSIAPDLGVTMEVPFQEVIGINLLPNRIATALASSFGLIGLLLATVGLYGLLSYLVVRRRREIGIRMALGAPAAQVRREILGDGLRLTLAGIGLGTAGAVALALAIRSLLFGIGAVDPISLGVSVLVMVGAAALACDIPARRAASTDPMEVLRND